MSGNKFSCPRRYKLEATSSVWAEYTDLAEKYNPVDLGQGFPDFKPQEFVLDCLKQVAETPSVSFHQYTKSTGHPRLCKALSQLYSPFLGRTLDPVNEIITTGGAYKGLHDTIFAHVQDGDEVILIEPFFDCYITLVRIAGGIPKFLPLRPTNNDGSSSRDWTLDRNELLAAFNSKTKAIILNTPHNPTGKIFSREELQEIADLCIKWNVLCISDEVYEWLTYNNTEHIRIATLEGMWERTITISSAGKAFGVTGWKIGWTYGPSERLENIRVINQNETCSPMQVAVAMVIETILPNMNTDRCFFKQQALKYEKKMRYLFSSLNKAGMETVLPDAGFFILANWTSMVDDATIASEVGNYKDLKFSKWIIRKIGILGIPPNSFYSKEHKNLSENYIRFCFVKKEEKLNAASQLLLKWTEK